MWRLALKSVQDFDMLRLRKASYASIGFLISLSDYPILVLIPVYYSVEFGMSLTAIGVIMFLARLLDVVSDPIVGIASDRISHRVSYRVWVLVGAPLYILALFALYQPDADADVTDLILLLVLLYTFRTVMEVPHQALVSAASESESFRLSLYGYRSVFFILGFLFTGAVVAWESGALGSALTMISEVAAIFLLPCLLMFWAFSPRPIKRAPVAFDGAWWKVKLDHVTKTLFVAFLFNQIANAFMASLAVIFIRDALGLEPQSGIFLGVIFLASALAVPFWFFLSSRYSVETAWAGALVLSVPVFVAPGFLSEGAFVPYLIICVLGGSLLGADAIYPSTLLARIANAGERDKGPSHGALFGLKSVLSKSALVIPTVIAFPIIEWFQASEGGAYTLSLVFFFAVLPALLKLVALLSVQRLRRHISSIG